MKPRLSHPGMIPNRQERDGGCRFQLQREAGGTRVRVEVVVKKNPIVKLMFGLMMKNKFRKSIRKSLENLKNYFAPIPQKQQELMME